jgi:glycyl-tRNA synthetase
MEDKKTKNDLDIMTKIVSLCKRRGYVFQSSEIYGGLKSAYDYGPLGVELKQNIVNEWWRSTVHERENVVGIDASIIMHSDVWKASGHIDGFSDPLVDCIICKERFRADKAPKTQPGKETIIELKDKKQAKISKEFLKRMGINLKQENCLLKGAVVNERGYVCPNCGSPFLSDERRFNLMFRTFLGPVDPISKITDQLIKNKNMPIEEYRKKVEEALSAFTVYLRPETAQGIFVQFANIQSAMGLKLPFGIAQQGKSFRNEITLEHFIFRSFEFEQMEMEYFCHPEEADRWLAYWKDERLNWYIKLGVKKENLREREHTKEELAHYAAKCYDIEYNYPWGWDELEGVANRTDYDLKKHSEYSGVKLTYFDPEKINTETGKKGTHFYPYIIEPSAGATRAALMFLLDAYDEEPPPEEGKEGRVVLRLNPKLAPIKVAVLPLVKRDYMPDKARDVVSELWRNGINSSYDEQHSIGRRYRRHDEAGTPFCLTIDSQTIKDDTVTIRYRDTMKQDRIKIEDVIDIINEKIKN